MKNKIVIKRDGSQELFDFNKIKTAITKALQSVGKEGKLTNYILPLYLEELEASLCDNENNLINIEDIQDAVELFLMKRYPEAAKNYIIYRYQHKEARFIKERLSYMDRYISSDENASSSSETDANANVSAKNVSNLEGEVYKTTNRIVQRQRMKEMLNKIYPEVADQYEKDLDHHIIYMHDEASTPTVKNYCMAVSLYPLLTTGVGNMDGITPKPPQHLDSFCGQFNNLAFLLSSQCKGAVAFGEFFNYFDYFCVKDFGEYYYEKEDLYADTEYVMKRKTISQKIEDAFQTVVYFINQPAGNRGYQSPFINFSYYDSNYWKALFGNFYFPDGTQPKWERVSYLQKKFMKWFNKERTKAVLTYPVETMALLTDGKDVIDKEYKDFTAEMHAEGHSFFVYLSDNPNGLASCCRLRNEIEENEFSFTNGLTGVETGSVAVITLNLNRIVQDCYRTEFMDIKDSIPETFKDEVNHSGRFDASFNYSQLKSYLTSILERVYKYHIAYKSLVYDWEERGMFSSSNGGYIHMNKLFSTIGINGLNEAARFCGIEVGYNDKYKEFCNLITGTIKEQNILHRSKMFKFNTEFVPAESLSSKNYKWDSEDGYWTPSDSKIYNSYFYNAWDSNTSVIDKFKLHGREFTETLDGGVGAHINLEEHLTKNQYLKLLDIAIENGTSYFTYNIPNSECTNDDCHYIVKTPMEKCPKCGAPMRIWTRVVGFLKPIINFDAGRTWDAVNRYYNKPNEIHDN